MVKKQANLKHEAHMKINEANIGIYTSLFRGREDVFARRWETKDKSGYAAAWRTRRNTS